MFNRIYVLSTLLLLAAAPAVRAQTEGKAVTTERAQPNGELRPGDIIRLRIWREPDLSGEFPVDAHGVVTFPKIGPQQVTGESEDALRERLVGLYQVYLRNPSIDIVFLRRINVLGSVRTPGLIPVDPTMVVADALALAGGVTPDGRQDKIRLIRAGEVLTANISQRTRIADLPLESGDQLYVPERSWLSRNTGLVISSGLSLFMWMITISASK
jgi:polysaccharide export outer membrane protein